MFPCLQSHQSRSKNCGETLNDKVMIRLLVTTQKDLLWGVLDPYLRSQALRYQFSSASHSLKTFSETMQNCKTGYKFHATLSSGMNSMSPFYVDSLCPGHLRCRHHSARVIAMQSDHLSLNHYLRVANQDAEHRLELAVFHGLLHTVPVALNTNQPYKQFSCRSMIQQTRV